VNAIRVSNRAGRTLGMALTAILLVGCRPARGGDITITVTGTVNGGRDYFGIFGLGRTVPQGTPYKLVFTFDDTKGLPMNLGRCPSSGSGITGAGPMSPGTAVLTINGKSFEFGRKPDARSKTWRSVATVCSSSEIGIAVEEGPAAMPSGVSIKVRPNQGQKPLTQNGNWQSGVSLSNFDARNVDNAFAIRRPWNYSAETMSYLSVDTVTISGR